MAAFSAILIEQEIRGGKTNTKTRVMSWGNRVGILATPSASSVTLGQLLNNFGPWLPQV